METGFSPVSSSACDVSLNGRLNPGKALIVFRAETSDQTVVGKTEIGIMAYYDMIQDLDSE